MNIYIDKYRLKETNISSQSIRNYDFISNTRNMSFGSKLNYD